jgi:hypothetical protein
VLAQWEEIKREVEGRGESHTELPENLPALLYARKALRRLDPAGSSGTGSSGEAKPGGPQADPKERDEAERRVGELLLDAVRESRRLGVDPELALRAASDRLAQGDR